MGTPSDSDNAKLIIAELQAAHERLHNAGIAPKIIAQAFRIYSNGIMDAEHRRLTS